MMRIAQWVSVSSVAVVIGLVGCSSSKTGGKNGGASGSGGLVEGNGGSGGKTGGQAGKTGTGTSGATGIGGGCSGTPVSCVDDATAQFCNPETNELDTANCAEEWAKDGFVSNGCSETTDGAGCTTDDVLDAECDQGVTVIANCSATATSEDLLNAYLNCFHDVQGLHEIVTCLGGFIDETAQTIDCQGAEAQCFPDDNPMPSGGTGGAGGTGGGGGTGTGGTGTAGSSAGEGGAP
jgi:hypothetical protein